MSPTRGELAVIGAPFNSDGTRGGVALAPAALRRAGLLAALPGAADLGDIDIGEPERVRDERSGLLAIDSWAATTRAVRAEVARTIAGGGVPLLLGGDCAVLPGALAGAADQVGDVGLVFVDGHEDAWPPHASITGEAADTELGLLLGRHADNLPVPVPRLAAEAVAVLGPRDLAEITEAGVPSLAGEVFLRPDDAVRSRPDQLGREAATLAGAAGRSWWLHVDLDVLGTDALAAVDYPQPGGLSWPELATVTTSALQGGGCLGMSLCIYNPALDGNGDQARAIVRYAAATGRHLRPRRQHD